MEPEILKKLAIGAVVPGAVAFISFMLLWIRSRRVSGHEAGRWIGEAFAAAPAIFAGFWSVLGDFSDSPRSSDQLMPYVGALAVGASMLAGAMRGAGGRINIGFALGVVALAIAAAMRTPMIERWAWWEQALLLAVASVASAATVVHALGLVQYVGARLGSFALMSLAGVAAQIIVLCFSSLKLGQLAGVIASVFGGMFAASLVFPKARISGAAIVSCVVVLTVTMMQGALYGEPELRQAVWPAMALPVGALLGSLIAKWMSVKSDGFAKSFAVIAGCVTPGILALVLWLTRAQDAYSA